ncbi:MAG TPA: nucleotidyltransferase domain-containing protein [Candidatus Nanoarchaeia archaeon]|nr:nucleotidyltransferase domain-containing protein [Candidatus Nanoarchaeia archaeon]
MIVSLDKNELIPRTISKDTIQKNCRVALEEIVEQLKQKHGKNIHSIYLYGSFSENRGKLKESDLDLFIITEDKFDFLPLERKISKKYSNLFVDVNLLSETKEKVLKDNYGWCAFVKIFCVCIWGENLSEKIPDYTISKELVDGFVADTKELIEGYLKSNLLVKKKSLAKLLIRRIYYSKLEEHRKWTTVLDEQYFIVKKLFPEKNFEELFKQATGEKMIESDEMKNMIDFTMKLVLQ